jgi:hypothetical protein
MFLGSSRAALERGVQVCASCQVRGECLEFGRRHRLFGGTFAVYGGQIVGGAVGRPQRRR